MTRPILFISHITEEKELANNLKTFLEGKFPGQLDVFVSSNEHSIELGQDWLDRITFSLRNCFVELILCSCESVKRPWINFEAGAGWARENNNVIPVCHSGMSPANLPLPLNLLQGISCSSLLDLQKLIKLIAEKLNVEKPSLECQNFIDFTKSFEEKYTYWNTINTNMDQFLEIMIKYSTLSIDNQILSVQNPLIFLVLLFNNQLQKVFMKEAHLNIYLKPLLEKFPIGTIEEGPASLSIGIEGTTLGLAIKKTELFDKIIRSPQFRYNRDISFGGKLNA